MGRTIVMVHGAFCGGWAFENFADYFRRRKYECLTPDLRLHGRRYVKTGNDELAQLGLADYRVEIEKLIETLDRPPIVIGHSMGGLIAQMLAANGHAAAAVMLAPSPPWGVLPSSVIEFASAQGLVLLMGDYWNSVLEPRYDIAERQALFLVPPEERLDVFRKFTPESGRATFEIMHWMLDHTLASAVDAAAVDCPMLFVAGRHDKVNPPKTVERTAKRYRAKAVFIEAEDHAHWLIGEPGWTGIAETAAEWLKSVGL